MGASVSVAGTYIGTLTDNKGKFRLEDVPEGSVRLLISFLDYGNSYFDIKVKGNTETGKLKIEKRNTDFDLAGSFSDLVKYSNATIHFDTVLRNSDKKGNFEYTFNEINKFSSSFVSTLGGGWNDQRVSVRGFDHKNIGLILNGIPVNDPFTGSFHWSDWGNISDFASEIQLQRGLGSSKLNGRSIGGSINILTSTGDNRAGGSVGFSYGSGSALKTTLISNSGLLAKRFSLALGVSMSNGSGIVDKTWFNCWTFYIGSRLKISNRHSLDIYAFATPQSHAQNLRQLNIASYSKSLAEEISDYNKEAFTKFKESASGLLFNPDWNSVLTSYNEKQYRYGKVQDRRYDDFINTSENYNEKPLANALWHARWNNKLDQLTSVYFIGANGGNTGLFGVPAYDRSLIPSGIVDFNLTNAGNAIESKGIMVSHVTNSKTFGGITKFNYSWNRNMSTTIGADFRNTSSEKFLEVMDLLGGKYFIDNSSYFRKKDFQAILGDTVAYNYLRNVLHGGTFIQTEFLNDDLAFNVMFGWAGDIYSNTDRFKKGIKDKQKDSLFYLKSPLLSSYQAKIGAKYIINDQMTAFGNVGFHSRPPLFDDVINGEKSAIASEPKSEYYLNYELGFKYVTEDQKLKAGIGLYLSSGNNLVKTFYSLTAAGQHDIHYVTGISAAFKGIEAEISYRFLKNLDMNLIASVADNKFTDNVSGSYVTYESGAKNEILTNYYILNLKTGIAPSTQLKLSAMWKPFDGAEVFISGRHLRDYYSDWDMTSRINDEVDVNGKIKQSWKMPSITIFDTRVSYKMNLKSRFGITIFGLINNFLNTAYIQDATDNSPENGYIIKDTKGNILNNHTAERAEVFVGLPRHFAAGVKLNF